MNGNLQLFVWPEMSSITEHFDDFSWKPLLTENKPVWSGSKVEVVVVLSMGSEKNLNFPYA